MSKGYPAPIVLFVYRRPDHTRQVLDSLYRNSRARESTLIVYSDAARGQSDEESVKLVRQIAHRARGGFRSLDVRERCDNWGLSRSLISGVSEVLKESQSAIILEDDLVVSEHFLDYMHEGLSTYQDEESVASVHAYSYPTESSLPETFFLRGADCWGWATWARAWNHFNANSIFLLRQLKQRGLVRAFDFDRAFPFSRMLQAQAEGRVDSWAIRWYASAFLDDMYTLYPGESLVQNIGGDGSGTHSGAGDSYRVSLATHPVRVDRQPVIESGVARSAFASFLKRQRPSLLSRGRRRVIRALPGR